jgi:hypothetical protein
MAMEVSALVVSSSIFEKGFDVTHSGSEMNDMGWTRANSTFVRCENSGKKSNA